MELIQSHCECLSSVRPEVISMPTFQTARSDFDVTADTLLLDLNENNFGPSITAESYKELLVDYQAEGASLNSILASADLNRYPEVEQRALKQAFCDFRNEKHDCELTPDNICFSSGMDDVIDLIMRCLCKPGQDHILTCPPHYHMYTTCAVMNNILVTKIPLAMEDGFQLQLGQINKALSANPSIKVCIICSPGNPTGAVIHLDHIKAILDNKDWKGVLVVDEAYIDFAKSSESSIQLIGRYPRLIVLQTLSKAFGLANIRVGFAVTCSHLSSILNNIKKPYAVSGTSIIHARAALSKSSRKLMAQSMQVLDRERQRLANSLQEIPGVGQIRGGLSANFVLFEVLDLPGPKGQPCNLIAMQLCDKLKRESKILVRFKGQEHGCRGCIRVTVSNKLEVDLFLDCVRKTLSQLYNTESKL